MSGLDLMSGLHFLMLQQSVVDGPKTRGMRESRGRKYLGEVGNQLSDCMSRPKGRNLRSYVKIICIIFLDLILIV